MAKKKKTTSKKVSNQKSKPKRKKGRKKPDYYRQTVTRSGVLEGTHKIETGEIDTIITIRKRG